MSSTYPQIYRNEFDGYTTTFTVWDTRRECVIRWENVSPTEVVIPYETELSPDELTYALESLLERAEDLLYDDYPFRCNIEDANTHDMMRYYECYWEPTRQYEDPMKPRVRVWSYGHRDSLEQCEIAFDAMRENLYQIEFNMLKLLMTLKY